MNHTTERALIAVGMGGGCIMATDGANIAFEVETMGTREMVEALGADKPDVLPGIYLWTGTAHIQRDEGMDGTGDPYPVFTGSLREVRQSEFPTLIAMTPPGWPWEGGEG